MKEIHFYEYAIQLKKCKFTQYECVGIKLRDNLYLSKFYCDKKPTGSERIINLNEFEIIQSYRILSFKDDSKYYNQLLLNEYEDMIHRSKEKIKKQEIFLQNLRLSI